MFDSVCIDTERIINGKGDREMKNIWGELFDPEWFERFKKVWGELEIPEEDLKKTIWKWK